MPCPSIVEPFFRQLPPAPRCSRGLAGPMAWADDLDAIRSEIEKRHGEAVKQLQEWIRQPSISAENRGMTEGCNLMMRKRRK